MEVKMSPRFDHTKRRRARGENRPDNRTAANARRVPRHNNNSNISLPFAGAVTTLNRVRTAFMVITNFGYGPRVQAALRYVIILTTTTTTGTAVPGRPPKTCVLRSVRDDAHVGTLTVIRLSVIR